MPDLDGEEDPQGHQKDISEAQWQAVLLQFWQGQLERINERLEPGIPKSRKAIEGLPQRLDKKFWDNENRLLLAAILPLLSDGATGAALFSAEAIEAATGLGIDWTLINTAAAEWARMRAGELIKGWKKPDGTKAPGLNERTKKAVRESVTQFVETPGRTIGDLRQDLAKLPAFGSNRAQMIAVTEVTRAAKEGNRATARAYEAEGLFTWERTWHTNRDGLVCELCRPLHGKKAVGLDGEYPFGGGDGPPRHPRGRCWETYRPIIGES